MNKRMTKKMTMKAGNQLHERNRRRKTDRVADRRPARRHDLRTLRRISRQTESGLIVVDATGRLRSFSRQPRRRHRWREVFTSCAQSRERNCKPPLGSASIRATADAGSTRSARRRARSSLRPRNADAGCGACAGTDQARLRSADALRTGCHRGVQNGRSRGQARERIWFPRCALQRRRSIMVAA